MVRKLAFVSVVLLLIYTVAGFFILPACLRPTLEKKLAAALGRGVAIDDIDVNPFVMSVRIKGFTVRDRQEKIPFVSFGELYVNVQARSVIKKGLVVQELVLKRPELGIVRLDQQTYNFSDLMKKKAPASDGEQKKPFMFSIGNISVQNGSVSFRDIPAGANHTVAEINLTIPFISNMGEFLDIFVQPRFSAKVNGTLFTLAGKTKPFKDSLETSLGIDLKGISLPFYMGYLPSDLKLGMSSGTVDLKAGLSYIQFKDRKPSLTVNGDMALHDFRVNDAGGQPLLSLPEVRLRLAPSSLMEKTIDISAIEIVSPELFVQKDKTGKLNLSSVSTGGKKKQKAGEEGGVTLDIRDISISNGSAGYTDLSKESPVRLALDEVNVKARNISTRKGSKGSLDISSRLNRNCSISGLAEIGIQPLVCSAKLDVRGLEPAWVQPYFTDSLRIVVTRGSISSKCSVAVEKIEGRPLSASFDGKVELSDFISLDKNSADDFVRCGRLALDGMKIGINPGFIDIDSIRLTDFSSRVLISPDGKLNLTSIVRKKNTKAGVAAEAGPKKKSTFERVSISRVVLDNARLRFTDRSIREGYSADLTRLKGTIRGLSSNRNARAEVNLSGILNRNAPVLVKGRINPFADSFFIDLSTRLNDLDLSPASPYSGKFVGYTIEKGKLSLDLTYLIDQKNLDSQNNVFIDQFTFGDSVDSPEATKLPVRFAVALLKDAHGKIDLKLPVKGRTDDPKFSVMGIIITMIKNLVAKAAVSPFLLLEAVYPGASQSNAVEFAYGRADLPEDARAKLNTISKILDDKPSLNLEIRGYTDRQADRQGLADYLFEKKLKAQKIRDLVKKGQEVSSARDVSIAPEEYALYLKKAYKAEEFPKPKNAIGIPLSLTPEEMEKLIRGHIEVRDSDLRLLAVSRAQRVQEYLLSTGISPSRIFLIDTEALVPEQRQGVKSSRVDLMLR